jgi:hypothetical protein
MHKPLVAARIGFAPDRRRTLALMEARGAQGVTRMIPDLRFVIGAVMATALLGVTLFGLAAAMHISHQSKLSPLEASRLLAYTPEGRQRAFDIPAPRFESPFAHIPADPNPVPMQQQPTAPAEAPVRTAAVTQPAPLANTPPAPAAIDPQPAPATERMPSAQPANLPPSSDDPDTVDERAVVDPPLPLDTDPPAAAANTSPVTPAPLPAAITVPPVDTTPAAPAPIVEQPPVTPDVPQVASIPTTTEAAETRADSPASAEEAAAAEPAKAKRKRAARKAAAKKRPARRRQAQAQVDAFGNPASTVSTANRPAQGFWGPFN